MKKEIPIFVVILIIMMAGSFYGGLVYGKNQTKSAAPFSEFRQGTGNGQGQGQGMQNRKMAGNMVNGDIIAKDDKSLTVKLRDGGSKIVLLAASTEVIKTASTTLDVLTVGTSISVLGDNNSDGSVTAKSIQLRNINGSSTPPSI